MHARHASISTAPAVVVIGCELARCASEMAFLSSHIPAKLTTRLSQQSLFE